MVYQIVFLQKQIINHLVFGDENMFDIPSQILLKRREKGLYKAMYSGPTLMEKYDKYLKLDQFSLYSNSNNNNSVKNTSAGVNTKLIMQLKDTTQQFGAAANNDSGNTKININGTNNKLYVHHSTRNNIKMMMARKKNHQIDPHLMQFQDISTLNTGTINGGYGSGAYGSGVYGISLLSGY